MIPGHISDHTIFFRSYDSRIFTEYLVEDPRVHNYTESQFRIHGLKFYKLLWQNLKN